MVQLTLKVITELKGCKSFAFSANTHFSHDVHLDWPTDNIAEHRAQYHIIATMFEALYQFETLPIDVNVSVEVQNGQSSFEGIAEPYDGFSQTMGNLLIGEVAREAERFADQYPKSKFTLKYSQTVTITRVDRKVRR